jgi:tripartite-type tricarboxylate transporter receptor subunit TctC
MNPARMLLTAMPALAALALGTVESAAQQWPTRAVTMVVPFGPGASNDTFTRAISQVLSKKFGQPFVVENRPGAGGVTATNQVVRAAPDGYTFVEMPNSISSFKQVLKVELDPVTDLKTISVFARSPSAMVVPSTLGVNSVAEFVEYAKKNPDRTFYGYAGIGATQHLHGALFATTTGLKLKGINYKSSAEAQTDLVAGRLHMMFATVASALGQIQGGQLKLLAYTADTAPPQSPKAPTMGEAGLKGMDPAQVWWAIFAPKGLPNEIATRMNAAINEALTDPGVVDLMARSGASPHVTTLDQAAKEVREEGEVLTRIIKEADIRIE